MHTIELVIFDCDGVLVDSEPITCAVLAEAIARLGVPWGTPDAIAAMRGSTLDAVLEAVERELGAPVPVDFVEHYRAQLFPRLRAEVRAIEGIHEALDALDRPTCVASNGPHEKMDATLGATDLLARFEGRIFSAYDTGRFKPDPELFVRAAAALGARPERCVVVEDTEHGLEAARAAGMPAVAYVADGRIVDSGGAQVLADMSRLSEALRRIAANW